MNKLHAISTPQDVDFVLAQVREFSASAREKCNEAEEIYKVLKLNYASLAELMAEAESYRKKESLTSDDVEELQNIINVSIDISESIQRISSGKALADEYEDLDDEQPELPEETDNSYNDKFFAIYNKHKARLGLNTQADVAKVTGLDRRYISVIESGKFKPQFKTLKKLADAFGIDVSVFTSGK